MVLDDLAVPIVLAPLAGGPSTPELTAAVSEAGGLGFLASGYLSAETTRDRIEAVRELSPPIGIGCGPGPISGVGRSASRRRRTTTGIESSSCSRPAP